MDWWDKYISIKVIKAKRLKHWSSRLAYWGSCIYQRECLKREIESIKDLWWE
jgi:hypothetical protein